MIKVIGYPMSDELLAVMAFLKWQHAGVQPEVRIDVGISLKVGKGVPSVILFDNDKQLAVGFFNIVKYWENNAMMLA